MDSRPIGHLSRVISWVEVGVICLLTTEISGAMPSCEGAPCACHGGQESFVVFSENLYLGADVVPVIRAALSGQEERIIRSVSQLWQQVQQTNFPERADAIARQIADHRADLVTLQEVALFRSGAPDSLCGNRQRATHVELDFLAALLSSLEMLGRSYTPIVVTELADLELPCYLDAAGPLCRHALRDLRFTDRLAILARTELIGDTLQIASAHGRRFDAHVELPVGWRGEKLVIERGWNSVDVACGGTRFRLINICLETNVFPCRQVAQVNELLQGPARTCLPVIVAGDSNSDANGPLALAYRRLLRAGFVDAWEATRGYARGYTYGNEPDLRNVVPMTHHPLSLLPDRFDQVLCRGPLEAVNMRRVGIRPHERTRTGMWPSDHAGVVATIRVR